MYLEDRRRLILRRRIGSLWKIKRQLRRKRKGEKSLSFPLDNR